MADKQFKRLFLHVGLGKTGSTSIQNDLLGKASLLERDFGICYPSGFRHAPEREGNHSLLLRSLFSDAPDARERLAFLGLANQAAIDDFNRATLARLAVCFEATSADTLLLSAESVGHFRRPQLLDLAGWLQDIAEEITVIACVRHPVGALSSEIQQRLAIGDTLEPMYQKPPIYRFKPLFGRLEEAFGKGNIRAYSFEAAVRDARGLTAVFLDELGIDAGPHFSRNPPANSSISHEGALLLDAYNRLHPPLLDGEPNPSRVQLPVNNFKKIPGRKYRAPERVYRRIQSTASDEVAWLQANYGIDLGEYHLEDSEPYRNFSDESIEYLAAVVAHQPRSLRSMLARLGELVTHPRLLASKLKARLKPGQVARPTEHR